MSTIIESVIGGCDPHPFLDSFPQPLCPFGNDRHHGCGYYSPFVEGCRGLTVTPVLSALYA